MGAGTVLVVITTNRGDSGDIARWLAPQLPNGNVVTVAGFHAAVSAIEQRARAVVLDIGVPEGRDDWRLAELRSRCADAAFVVVGDATLLPMLAGATSADLAVTSASDLPPLRELLLTDEPVVTDQPHSDVGRSGRTRR